MPASSRVSRDLILKLHVTLNVLCCIFSAVIKSLVYPEILIGLRFKTFEYLQRMLAHFHFLYKLCYIAVMFIRNYLVFVKRFSFSSMSK